MRFHILTVPGADPHRDRIVDRYLTELGPEACAHEDPERRGIMPNFLSALEDIVASGDRWSVILQDDAEPIGDAWRDHVWKATYYSPAPVLCMTHFGAITEPAHRRGVPYLVGPHLIWGGAVAFRGDFAKQLLGFGREFYEATGYPHDDRLVSGFANRIGVQTALTTRAIFDQPVEKSLVGHGGQNRRPNVTIRQPGADYGVVPRSSVRVTGAAADQRLWIRTWGTELEDPTYTFKPIRNGAVRWLAKEES